MRTLYTKKFLKDLAKIPAKTRVKIEEFPFDKAPNLETVEEAQKLEKMKGFPLYYKIRFGDYRVGLKLEDDEIIFERALHRKNIPIKLISPIQYFSFSAFCLMRKTANNACT